METLVRETTIAAQSVRSEQASKTALANTLSFAFALTAVFIAGITMAIVGAATSSTVILSSAIIITTVAAFVGVYGILNMMTR
jgi:hypothetical protein